MQEYLYGLATDKNKGAFSGLIKIFLLVFSWLYGCVVLVLIFIYSIRPHRLKCKVISVGNITLGGTGKTALVEFISQYLKEKGRKLAVLSRGYRRKILSCPSSGAGDYLAMGDEPYMLKARLKDVPILVDSNRIRSGEKAIRDYGVDTVILDDGLQQWKIEKDLEIVTVDATYPFGNRHLLPRGILRQPIGTLKKADVFILTKTDLGADIQAIRDALNHLNPEALIVETVHKPMGFYKLGQDKSLFAADIFKGKTAALISGIAEPDSFENTVRRLGINIGASFKFPDHHRYSQKDLNDVFQKAKKEDIQIIVTTEKDAVRIIPLQAQADQTNIFVLRIEIKITKDEERFYHRLLKLYSL
jgi:tetraacyldisaccharide 4'-kinase